MAVDLIYEQDSRTPDSVLRRQMLWTSSANPTDVGNGNKDHLTEG